MFVDLEKDKVSIIWLHVMSNILCPNQKHDGTTFLQHVGQMMGQH
jgi:hypothetical protein